MVLIVVVFSFAGCGGSDDEALPSDGSALGFAAMKVGSWEELTTPDGDRERYEFMGTDTYNGKECYILEFELKTHTIRSRAETSFLFSP